MVLQERSNNREIERSNYPYLCRESSPSFQPILVGARKWFAKWLKDSPPFSDRKSMLCTNSWNFGSKLFRAWICIGDPRIDRIRLISGTVEDPVTDHLSVGHAPEVVRFLPPLKGQLEEIPVWRSRCGQILPTFPGFKFETLEGALWNFAGATCIPSPPPKWRSILRDRFKSARWKLGFDVEALGFCDVSRIFLNSGEFMEG